MRKYRRTIALLLVCLLLTACGKNDPIPTETTVPAETVSQSPEAMGLDSLTVQTAEGLADVTCEETEAGVRLTSANPATDAGHPAVQGNGDCLRTLLRNGLSFYQQYRRYGSFFE